MYALTTLSLAFLLSIASGALVGGRAQCESFGASLSVPNTKVLHMTYYTGNETIPLPGLDPSCAMQGGTTTRATAAMCRVALLVDTSPGSQVQLEAWLPDEWSGRVSVVGNGGLNGCKCVIDRLI